MKTVSGQRSIVAGLILVGFLVAACNQTPDVAPSLLEGGNPIIVGGDPLKARDFGTASDDYGFDIAANSTGVYAVGQTYGALDGVHKGSGDAFVRKYDGGVVWAQQFGTRAYDVASAVAVDNAGNSYVTGQTDGALGFKVGGTDVFLRKYNTNGVVQWTRQFGTKVSDSAEDVATDGSGNVFVLSRDNNLGFAVRKFTAAGVLLVSRTVTNPALPELNPRALATDNAGNVIVLAQWNGGANTGTNIRVFKLTTALVDVWNVPFQETAYADFAYDITTFGTDIYLTAVVYANAFGYGARYGKLTGAGVGIAAQQLEPTTSCNCTTPDSITVDGSGSIYVAATTSRAFSGFTNAGAYDIVVFKYNSANTRLWAKQLGQGNYGSTESEYALGIAVSDAVYITGYTNGNLLGDPKYSANFEADAFLGQIDKTTGAVIGIDQ
jgi:large repetitive protein